MTNKNRADGDRQPIRARNARWIHRAAVMLATGFIASCALFVDPRSEIEEPAPGRVAPETVAEVEDGVLPGFEEEEVTGGIEETEYYPARGEFVDRSAMGAEPMRVPEDGEIVLNFEGESIQSVVHTVLGEVMQENFVIGPGVSGQVTFSTARPVSQDQLMPILEMLLRWNGATLVWMDDRWHVLPVSDAVRGNLTPAIGNIDQVRGYAIRALPLEYVSAAEMHKILEPYAREDAILNVDMSRNMLFVAGTRDELANYQRIVDIFDVNWLAGMSVGIYPLESVEVEAITAELESIFGAESESPLAGMFRFVPLERLGSVMVITPQPEYLDRAQDWINRLDRGAAGGGQRLFVYKVKNLEAPVLANYLIQLYGGERAEGRQQNRTGLAPGLEPVQVGSVSDFNSNRLGNNQNNRQGQNAGGGTSTINTGEGDDVRITAVLETNSLIIQATQNQYDSIQAAISRIDEEPLQVLIEAQVLDVSLNENLEFGVSWFLSNNDAIRPEGFAGLNDAGRYVDSATGGSSGLFTNIIRPIAGTTNTFVQATINALDSVTDVRSVSAPSLLVRNNSEASITVGTQVPVRSSSISTGNDNVVSSAQYVSTGVILTVTPRINPGGLVYLDISQEVSTADEPAQPGDNPPINNKQVSSQVAVQSGQTVFLGGLISERDGRSRSGVPGLARVPFVGSLFGTKGKNLQRVETVVMVTPTVIENAADLEVVSETMEDEFTNVPPIEISTLKGSDYPVFEDNE